jgi:membrane protein
MGKWRDTFSETRQEMAKDNVSLVAAGVAFYIFLSVIPAVAAIISFYGLVMDADKVEEHARYLTSILPAETQEVEQQILEIATDRTMAGWGAVVGLLVALWSSSKATKALIQATNLAYNCSQDRSFIKLTLLSLALTLAGMLFVTLAIVLVAVLPAVLQSLGLGSTGEILLTWLRWPLLLAAFLLALAVLYRYAPNRQAGKWRFVSIGAVVAAVLWVGGSLLMSLYVSQFANINKTYGSLGAIVLLLLWFYLSAYAVLIGAELNAVKEKREGGNGATDANADANADRQKTDRGEHQGPRRVEPAAENRGR